MPEQTYQPVVFVDMLTSAEGGMNSGVSPLLLEKNQIGVGINVSLRGGFLKNRPPIQKKTLNFGGDAALQTLVETGFFQGAGYYRPDFGTESLLAQISGHLLKFTEVNNLWIVTDVSAPNDLNDANTSQVWMWQSEKWMIISDGTGKPPIFFNGQTSRRSYGSSQSLITTSGGINVPAIGSLVTVNTSALYTGQTNLRVLFGGEYWLLTNSNFIDASTGYYRANLSPVLINPNNHVIANGASIYAPGATVTQVKRVAGLEQVAQTRNENITASSDLTVLSIPVYQHQFLWWVGYQQPGAPAPGLCSGSVGGVATEYDCTTDNAVFFQLGFNAFFGSCYGGVFHPQYATLNYDQIRTVSRKTPYVLPAGSEFNVTLDSAPAVNNLQIGIAVNVPGHQTFNQNGSPKISRFNIPCIVIQNTNGGQTLRLRTTADVNGVDEYLYAGGEQVNSDLYRAAHTNATTSDYSFLLQGKTITIPATPSCKNYAPNHIITEPVSLNHGFNLNTDGSCPDIVPNGFIYTTPEISQTNLSQITLDAGTEISFPSYQAPNYKIATVATDVAINPTAIFEIKTLLAYTGIDYQTVYIDASTYKISKLPPVPPTQAVKQVILQNLTDANIGHSIPAASAIYTVPEIPACRMGAYGMARNWFSLIDGVSYAAGDIVGGASGTANENYRDAVLFTTENDFLAAGGSFRIPGTGDIITAMIFPPIVDTSLGQGPLQIFTPNTVFSNNSPVDRATWAAVGTSGPLPLQTESLKDKGALAQNSTILINSDTFFRADDGVGSLVLARRDFGGWGNKPISNEMQRILTRDNKSLLNFSSATSFDNRFLITCSPQVLGRGVFHVGMVSLNFDLISSLRTSQAASWEGAWTGINALQLVSGRVNNSKRTFSFTYNVDSTKIELYELLPENTAQYLDNGVTPIGWFFETPILFGSSVKPVTALIQLRGGECYISGIKGDVTVKVFYKPDFYPCWTLWREFTLCADLSASNAKNTYQMRVGLGEPSADDMEPVNNRPMRVGNFFQTRVEINGACVWNGIKVSAIEVPQDLFAPVAEAKITCDAIDCDVTDDLRTYSLQGLPALPLPAITPEPCLFKNLEVYSNPCPNL